MYAILSVIILLSSFDSNQASVMSMFESSENDISNMELDFDVDLENSLENVMEIDPLLFPPVNPIIDEDAQLNVVQIQIRLIM